MDGLTEYEKLHQLNTLVLTDAPVSYVFPLYPFTETPDNEASVLLRSEELLRFNQNTCMSEMPILLTDNLGGSEPGYPGAKSWVDGLKKLGVSEHEIMLIPFTEPLLQTLSEAFTVARFVQERGWTELVIIAPPFHALRCFLSMVTAIQTLETSMKVYMQVGITQNWSEHAVHSQKTTQGKRKDLIIGEIRRIQKYQKEGTPVPLISTDGALAYLEWRDKK